jgi:uncharacterized membrane protein YbhN (UPF0104 family)
MDYRYIFALIILFLPIQFISATRWYFILKRIDQSIPFWLVMRYYSLGQLSSLYLPGRTSGDVIRAIAVIRNHENKGRLIFSILLDKISLLLVLTVFSFVGPIISENLSEMTYVSVISIFVFFIASVVFLIMTLYRGGKLVALLKSWFPNQFMRFSFIENGFSIPRLSVPTISTVLVLGIIFQLSNATGNFLLAQSMFIPVKLLDWISISAIVSIVQILPITLGGFGVREGALIGILSLYNIQTSKAVAFSFVAFSITSVMTLLLWLILDLIDIGPAFRN